jgi:hypothetical protein
MNNNYSSVGRWEKCLHCGVILRVLWGDAKDVCNNPVRPHETHLCGAPWQTIPFDVPREWLSGFADKVESPFSPELQRKIEDLQTQGEELLKYMQTLIGTPCS